MACWITRACAPLLLFLSIPASTPAQPSPTDQPLIQNPMFRGWHRSWDRAALASVRKQNSLAVLALQDGCEACHQALSQLQAAGGRNLFRNQERLVLDVGDAASLATAQQMGIRTTPTLIVYRARGKEMTELGRHEGRLTIREIRRMESLSGALRSDDQPTTKTSRRSRKS